jgi:hypothetical protein
LAHKAQEFAAFIGRDNPIIDRLTVTIGPHKTRLTNGVVQFAQPIENADLLCSVITGAEEIDHVTLRATFRGRLEEGYLPALVRQLAGDGEPRNSCSTHNRFDNRTLPLTADLRQLLP